MNRDVVGLLPAAGTASRVGRLPCSKEVWPVGFRPSLPARPIVAAEYLLYDMADAGVSRAYVVLRRGKWDIPDYLGDEPSRRPDLAFIVIDATEGVPFSLDHAYPWIRGHTVALGFPDIIYRPRGVFTALLDHQGTTGADVTLGLFRATNPRKMDMVSLDSDGRVREIVIKPERTDLRWTWIHCVWGVAFTDFLHDFVAGAGSGQARELHAGDVIQAAIDAGMLINSVTFDDAEYLDIGTPEDLAQASRTTLRWMDAGE